MPQPKVYPHGRQKITLEKTLASMLQMHANRDNLPMTTVLDDAVTDYLRKKSGKLDFEKRYLREKDRLV